MSHYDSDDSTLVNEEHSRRQRRPGSHRSSSQDWRDSRQTSNEQGHRSFSFQDFGRDNPKLATAGKVAVVVGIVGVLLHKWRKEKEERERARRRRHRREFESAKRARRREEDRREREEEELENNLSPPRSVRRIEYRPAELSRSESSSSSGSRRRLETSMHRAEGDARSSVRDARHGDDRRGR